MIEKIYADYKKIENENIKKYLKSIGIIDAIEKTTPKKNIDLSIILEKSGLLKTDDNLKTKIGDEIDTYTEDVFKQGIKIGVKDGQKNLLKELKNNENLYSYLSNVEIKEFIKSNVESTFINNNIEFKNSNENYEKTKNKYIKELFNKLCLDEDHINESLNKKLKLNPKSKKIVLMSSLYKMDKGKFKVSDLIDKHYFNTLFQGREIGIIYGEKMIIEDIQTKKLRKQDINRN